MEGMPTGASEAEWALFSAYQDRICRYVLSLVRDPNAARGWLYRIATHVCLDRLRQRAPHVPMDSREAACEVECAASKWAPSRSASTAPAASSSR